MYNKILVPLDGSELAERALPLAFQLVQQSEGEVVLVRALTPDRVLVPDALSGYGLLWPEKPLEDARAEARTYLNHWRSKAPGGARVRYVLAEGSAAETIAETAVEEKADLIVMSSHGYSGLTRWMLGSVAERVLHAAHCPVLVIRGDLRIQHILLPLDGSELSERALRPTLDVAEVWGAKVTLLRAIRTVPLTDIEALNTAERGLGQRYTEELVREAQDYLDFKARTSGRPRVELHTVVTPEPPADAILNYAERHPVDLIAMSTHGRTGLSRWMYGSVTEKVLRVSHRSMLVVRS
jgi:nucleotide-binding universal stress UspA family protein